MSGTSASMLTVFVPFGFGGPSGSLHWGHCDGRLQKRQWLIDGASFFSSTAGSCASVCGVVVASWAVASVMVFDRERWFSSCCTRSWGPDLSNVDDLESAEGCELYSESDLGDG